MEFLKLFEMPLLGYIGYLFFAWELYALRNFLWPKAPALRLQARPFPGGPERARSGAPSTGRP